MWGPWWLRFALICTGNAIVTRHPGRDHHGSTHSDFVLGVWKPRLQVNSGQQSKFQSFALPDLICQLQIAVGTAGLHLPAPDPSHHCRTSSASPRSQWALPDFICQPQIAVALPDFIRELQIPVGTAGLQPRAPDSSGHCRTSTCIHARKNARQNAR
eukprot:s504_g15.t1